MGRPGLFFSKKESRHRGECSGGGGWLDARAAYFLRAASSWRILLRALPARTHSICCWL